MHFGGVHFGRRLLVLPTGADGYILVVGCLCCHQGRRVCIFGRRSSVLAPGAEDVHVGRSPSVLFPVFPAVGWIRGLTITYHCFCRLWLVVIGLCVIPLSFPAVVWIIGWPSLTIVFSAVVGWSLGVSVPIVVFEAVVWTIGLTIFHYGVFGCGWWSWDCVSFPIVLVSQPAHCQWVPGRVRVGEFVFWRWSETRGIKDQAPNL